MAGVSIHTNVWFRDAEKRSLPLNAPTRVYEAYIHPSPEAIDFLEVGWSTSDTPHSASSAVIVGDRSFAEIDLTGGPVSILSAGKTSSIAIDMIIPHPDYYSILRFSLRNDQGYCGFLNEELPDFRGPEEVTTVFLTGVMSGQYVVRVYAGSTIISEFAHRVEHTHQRETIPCEPLMNWMSIRTRLIKKEGPRTATATLWGCPVPITPDENGFLRVWIPHQIADFEFRVSRDDELPLIFKDPMLIPAEIEY